MKEIKLKPEGIAMVDDEDYDFLSKYKWYNSKVGYAIFGEGKDGIKPFCKMHRLILNIEDSKIIVDHKDGNKLNNQRLNLRIVTPSQNVHNSNKRKNTQNKFKGVFYVKKLNLWQSRCRINGLDFYLGLFKTEIAAAYAYNKKAIELTSYAKINYLPQSIDILEQHYLLDRAATKKIKSSKYKYIYYKLQYDKWYIRFSKFKKNYYKGYFLTENEAKAYLVKHYSNIIDDAGAERNVIL